jgi:hypothetical protein
LVPEVIWVRVAVGMGLVLFLNYGHDYMGQKWLMWLFDTNLIIK